MKKLLIAVSFLSLLFSAQADMKIGTVDLMLLIRNHPSYDSNKELLKSTDKDYQKKLEAIKGEGDKLQEEGKKLVEQMQNPMLAAKAKGDLEKQIAEIQKQLMSIEQRYRSEAMRCRQDLSDLEGRLLKTTTDDLKKRIKAYAEKEGYDFIVDRSVTPYAKEVFDVSDAILSAMGVDLKKVKTDESK